MEADQGFIDRLIITENEALIIDYKTHDNIDKNDLNIIALQYRGQMHKYKSVIQQLYPGKTISTTILFTHYLVSIKI